MDKYSDKLQYLRHCNMDNSDWHLNQTDMMHLVLPFLTSALF